MYNNHHPRIHWHHLAVTGKSLQKWNGKDPSSPRRAEAYRLHSLTSAWKSQLHQGKQRKQGNAAAEASSESIRSHVAQLEAIGILQKVPGRQRVDDVEYTHIIRVRKPGVMVTTLRELCAKDVTRQMNEQESEVSEWERECQWRVRFHGEWVSCWVWMSDKNVWSDVSCWVFSLPRYSSMECFVALTPSGSSDTTLRDPMVGSLLCVFQTSCHQEMCAIFFNTFILQMCLPWPLRQVRLSFCLNVTLHKL